MKRIEFLQSAVAAVAAVPATAASKSRSEIPDTGKRATRIDRPALVSRHNVVLRKFEGERPIQVGNGEFAFGLDATGLQTFAAFNTMSHWGWHCSALPAGVKLSDYHEPVVATHGRPVPYALPDPQQPELSAWLAANPHRINLGRIGLSLTRADGTAATQNDLRDIHQTLDLWNGIATSRFTIDGQPVVVTTACHPGIDAIAAQIESPLIQSGHLAVFLECPGNNPLQFANFVGDWSHLAVLETLSSGARRADFRRTLDDTVYSVSLAWSGDAAVRLPNPNAAATLTIVKAEYGAGSKWLDVTEIAAKAVQNGRHTNFLLRSNSIA